MQRLFDTIADNARAGKDIKLLSDRASDWDDLCEGLEDRFNSLGMSAEEKEVAHCLVRFAEFKGVEDFYQGTTHNKMYMLDHQSFYIGSQNMYPNGLRDYWDNPAEHKEHGFFIDTTPLYNSDLAQTVVDEYAAPAWQESTDDPGEGPFITGVVDTDNQFVGTISGTTIYGGDSADLLGSFEQGVFDAAFSGLEPLNNVVYSGTVTTTTTTRK